MQITAARVGFRAGNFTFESSFTRHEARLDCKHPFRDPEAIRDYLRKKGYFISTVSTGRQALAVLKERETDLAIFDYFLNDIAGTELLAAIKDTSPKTAVVITADDDTALTTAAIELGIAASGEEEPVAAIVIDDSADGINEIPLTYAERFKESALKAEYEIILEVLASVKYNHTQAAKILRIDRKTLYNKLRHFRKD